MNAEEIAKYIGSEYQVFYPIGDNKELQGYELRIRKRPGNKRGSEYFMKSVKIPPNPSISEIDEAVRALT